MCTVSVKVDEELIREVLPELENTASIRRWAQALIDARLRELVAEDEETMDVEEARELVHETIRTEYAQL
jgi:hypothetical protein